MKGLFSLSTWSAFERTWLAAFCLVGAWLCFVWGENFLGFTVFLSGVLCVVLAAKGHIATYPAGMYNNFGYAYLAWSNHLFGEMSLYLLFYVPTSIIGFFMWRKHLDDAYVEMRALPAKAVGLIALGCAAAFIALGYALSTIAAQNTPYIDAATNVLSITATLLMMWRYREQWAAYIALNALSCAMWILRTLDGSRDGPVMTVMWTAFLVNAVYGYINWSRGAKRGGR